MKETKNIVLSFLLLLPFLSVSQTEKLSRHPEVNEFVSELLKSEIDTICDYEIFNEENEAFYTQYIFWKENGKTKLKKLEYEKNYPVIEVDAQNIWEYLSSNTEVIKNEDVRPFTYQENNEDIYLVSEGRDMKEFNFYLKGNIVQFLTSGFDFQKTEKVDGHKVINIYFDHNRNLKGKVVIDMYDLLTKDLEKKRSFGKG